MPVHMMMFSFNFRFTYICFDFVCLMLQLIHNHNATVSFPCRLTPHVFQPGPNGRRYWHNLALGPPPWEEVESPPSIPSPDERPNGWIYHEGAPSRRATWGKWKVKVNLGSFKIGEIFDVQEKTHRKLWYNQSRSMFFPRKAY